MSLRSKILAMLTAPAAVLLCATGTAYFAESRAAQTSRAVEYSYEVKVRVATLLGDLESAESALRGWVLTGRDEFIASFTTGSSEIETDMSGLAAAAANDPGLRADVTRLNTLITDRMTLFAQLKALGPINDGESLGVRVARMREGQQVTETIKSVLNEMDSRESFLLGQRKRELEFAQETAFTVAVIGTPVAVLIAFAGLVIFSRKQLARLRKIEENMHRLETGSALVEPDDAPDELGNLGRLLVQSATQVIELQNELRHLATTDPLTRLMNRRGFLTFAERQLSVAQRTQRSVALIFMDVDGLKTVNDTLGHNVGDAMIAEAAHVIKSTFRSSDLAAKVGGDEFCVLLTSGEDIAGANERLTAEVQTRNEEPDRPYELSLSLGTAVFDPKNPCSLDDLMQEADAGMYEHKRSKRAGVA